MGLLPPGGPVQGHTGDHRDVPDRAGSLGHEQIEVEEGLLVGPRRSTIPMEEIVRKALRGKSRDFIEVLPFKEGLELENADAPRRYRDRPPAETGQ